jgi:hypothetical protein
LLAPDGPASEAGDGPDECGVEVAEPGREGLVDEAGFEIGTAERRVVEVGAGTEELRVPAPPPPLHGGLGTPCGGWLSSASVKRPQRLGFIQAPVCHSR